MMFTKLIWGVKASFRSYVKSSEGSITFSDGVTVTDDGEFIFTAAPGGDFAVTADGRATGSMRFNGSVTFEAHGGMLKSTLSELGVEASGEGILLTVLDAPMNKSRCTVAELGPVEMGAGEVVTFIAKITVDGMYQIADNYPPGTVLDPVILG